MEYHCFMEKMKKEAATCCCLDYNGLLGQNLTEKLQSIYVTLVRMQHITRKVSGSLPNILIVQPVIKAMLDITSGLTKYDPIFGIDEQHPKTNLVSELGEFEYAGNWLGEFEVYVDEKAWMEHHILMTNLVDGKLSEDPKLWCKVSLLNLIMQNNFGYFNMC